VTEIAAQKITKNKQLEEKRKKRKIQITREHLTEQTERFCFAFTIKSQKETRKEHKRAAAEKTKRK
jgi:hypothetical protein